MPALLQDLLRLRHDRRAPLVVASVAAVVYALIALPTVVGIDGSSRAGIVIGGSTLLLALAIACSAWRAEVALFVGSAAIVAVAGIGAFRLESVEIVTPYLGVLVPVLAGALDPRPWVHRFAVGLACVCAVLIVTWGYAGIAAYSGRPGIAVSALIVCGAPIAVGAIWRHVPLRQRITAATGRWVASVSDGTVAARAIWIAAVFYLACIIADLGAGTLASLLTAAPLAAALIWWRTRPDVALGLAATGLAVTAVIMPLDSRFGPGETAAVLSAAVPVFGALIGESIRFRRLAYALVAAAVVVSSRVTASMGIGGVVLIVGGLVVGTAWAWRQRSTAGSLRVRLRESERRGRVAERGVQVEQERTRIAREVHDVVAHSLAVVIAQADGARFAASTTPTSVAPALEAIADTARTALGEVRTMLHDLRTSGNEGAAPGPEDIDAVIATVRTLGIDVHSVTYGRARRTTDDAGLAMFRIAQEAMTYALRHGDRSAPIAVDIDWGEQGVVLSVTNAVPADVLPATERAGHGIPGMIERAALVGGECTAGLGSSGRFRVRATLPVLPGSDAEAEDEVADALHRLFAAEPRAS